MTPKKIPLNCRPRTIEFPSSIIENMLRRAQFSIRSLKGAWLGGSRLVESDTPQGPRKKHKRTGSGQEWGRSPNNHHERLTNQDNSGQCFRVPQIDEKLYTNLVICQAHRHSPFWQIRMKSNKFLICQRPTYTPKSVLH